MTVCVAYGCSNRTDSKPRNVTFHSFPKNPEIRRAWIIAVRRANWMPSKCSMLCSEHFTEDMFDRSSTMLVRLHKGAVPSVFKGFPKELQEKLKKLPPPKIIVPKSKFLSEDAKETDIVPRDINPPKYLGPGSLYTPPKKTCDMSLEIQRQKNLKELREREGQMKLESVLRREQKFLKTIKSLTEKTVQQEKQIQNMEEIISNLKKEHYKRFEETQNFVLFTNKQTS